MVLDRDAARLDGKIAVVTGGGSGIGRGIANGMRAFGAQIAIASALSSYVTGQTLHVDGGTSASMGWYHHPEDGHYVYGPWFPSS
jgi:NAD(P)-dependent dehydrogenase (short-subunit alcohol dehydrogenase family)